MKLEPERSAGACSYCGKQTYSSRKIARQAIRRAHAGDSTMNAYECVRAVREGFHGLWHIGHLYAEIVHGEMKRMRP